MAKQQDQEWVEAQKIVISTNLTAAAKKHLQFLEVVEKNGELYDGPILEKAIFRYKYYWLPLLAEYTNASQLPESPLVVPLDCEWIWHCHRLNPVCYMVDCIQLFGKILDPSVVVSSIEGTCKKQTEEIWKKKYPEEAYELNFGDHNIHISNLANLPASTNYDLTSAVKRQSSFFQKVSEAIFRDDLYLEEAAQRYKGFLHLVKRNIEKKLNNPCVPTYDIDLMWHTHQLHPRSYCKDVIALVGQVLHHDDTDTDQSKGGKLDVGVKTTTEQWREMFGCMYWRPGSRSSSDTTIDMEGSMAMTEDMRKHGENMAKCIVASNGMVEEKSGARCLSVPVENMAKCIVASKNMAKCIVASKDMVEEKSGARCLSVPVENMAKCIVASKNMAKCIVGSKDMVEEKSGARCLSVPVENMAKCIVASKNMAKCIVACKDMVEEKSGARCLSVPVENMAKCIVASKNMVEQKSTARGLCAPVENMAKCIVISKDVVEKKLTAKCKCIPANNIKVEEESAAKTARCWCISDQIDGHKLIMESIASGAIQV